VFIVCIIRRKFDSYIDPKQSTGPSREYSAEQIERILIQNETLKQSVKELHDRLTQVYLVFQLYFIAIYF